MLEAQGFKPIPVPEQATPDGQFPNVTKQPNPEVPECMDRAEQLGLERGARTSLSPPTSDADRLGAMANRSPDGKGTFRFIIAGNEIGRRLLTHFKLAQLARGGSLPASPIVITTEVTTGQITRIGRQFSVRKSLTICSAGFKYHADVGCWQIETTGQYGDVRPVAVSDFVIATEESHGIMATAGVRDKDSACAALLLAEAALYQKRQGRTVPDYLDDLNRQFGYYRNELLNIIMA